MTRAYFFARLVSLDVSVAALAGGIMATRVIGSRPKAAFYGLLPVAVWVVYTLDHLLDARRLGNSSRTPRHRFHARHAPTLWCLMVACSIVAGVGGFMWLSWTGVIFAALMAGLVVGHEAMVKLAGNRASPLLVKELGVAVIFTAGVWGLPWIRHRADSGHWLDWPVVLVVQYGLLAAVNLVEFALFELSTDISQGSSSFVRGIGPARARRFVAVSLIVGMGIGVVTVAIRPDRLILGAESVYLGMTAGLAAIVLFPSFFRRRERYRALGDGVFLLPLVMLLIR